MIKMYSKTNCSYCSSARTYLQTKNIPFEEYKLDVDFKREFIIQHFPSAKTYPIIIDNDEYIGGFVDLKRKYDTPLVLEYGAFNGA